MATPSMARGSLATPFTSCVKMYDRGGGHRNPFSVFLRKRMLIQIVGGDPDPFAGQGFDGHPFAGQGWPSKPPLHFVSKCMLLKIVGGDPDPFAGQGFVGHPLYILCQNVC